MPNRSSFVHLHLHTEYSLLDGACPIKRTLEKAVEYGMPAIAITDHGNMFGVIDFYKSAIKAGIKPIIGMEAYVAPGSRQDRQGSGKTSQRYYHLILLASNLRGYQNLIRLSSIGYIEGFYSRPRIDMEVLSSHSEGLIGLSSCLKGEIAQHIQFGDLTAARRSAETYSRVLGEGNYYLELQNHGLPQQKLVNEAIVEIGRELGIPFVATNDVHYLNREDAEAHDVLLCIQTGKTLDDPDRMHFDSDELYFKSPEEMADLFQGHPEALANTVEIAKRCDLELEFGKIHMPHFPIPDGYDDLDSYLADEAERGLRTRYGEVSGEIRERLRYELDVIRQAGYSGYFLIVRDFIEVAKRNHIPVGPGRGSIAGCLVAYSLGITDVDPIRYGLLFERFLNLERVTMPDIDIDFCYERRGEVIRYVREKYGDDNVAQIITFGRRLARAVVRDVGRVLNIPLGEVDRIAKLIPNQPGASMDIQSAVEKIRELRELVGSNESYQRLMKIARTLEGMPRHASIHAAGVVIAPQELVNFAPLYTANGKEITTQYEMKSAESIGLLKMDFLGLKTVTVIYETVESIARNGGPRYTLENIPLDDAKVYRLLGEGRTSGVFQFEGNVPTDVLKRMKPNRFEDLIAVNALIRPGALKSGMTDEYIFRKKGEKGVEYPHPSLENILADTFGVILYQEQVMQIANEMAGFSLGKADILRWAMGKKKKAEMGKLQKDFIIGAKEKGIDKEDSKKIWDLMHYFSGYGFNKSHSAAYSLLSYYTAFFKANHPREYMAALLSSEMGNTDKVVHYIGECRDMGIDVLPPDVNESGFRFTVVEDGIRFGLGAVKNVGRGAIESIIEAREKVDGFETIYDFLEAVDLRLNNKRVVESLIMSGALDSVQGHRAQLLEGLDKAIRAVTRVESDRIKGQMNLFEACGDPESTATYPPLPKVKRWNKFKKLAMEKELIGFYISGHPLERYKGIMTACANSDTATFQEESDDREHIIGGVFTQARRLVDRKGKEMAFATLEDFKGTIEVIAFNEVFERHGERIKMDLPVIVRGRRSRRDEEIPRMVLEEVIRLDDLHKNGRVALRLMLSNEVDEETLEQLKAALLEHPGNCPVLIAVRENGTINILRSQTLGVLPSQSLIMSVQGVLEEEAVDWEKIK
jgi:DNA polymerase-3 subunit alpha